MFKSSLQALAFLFSTALEVDTTYILNIRQHWMMVFVRSFSSTLSSLRDSIAVCRPFQISVNPLVGYVSNLVTASNLEASVILVIGKSTLAFPAKVTSKGD